MPGLVPGIHGTPTGRQPLLNSRVFPQPATPTHIRSLNIAITTND
jgi:hypothetical protein